MPFANQILGGAGTLIRKMIKSPNYVPGVSGWTINKDGTVEFNNGTFRGTITSGAFKGTDFIINSDGAFFYTGPPALGNLFLSLASLAGADNFTNPYGAGVNVGNQSAGPHCGIDTSGRIFLFNNSGQQLFELSGPDGGILAKDTTGALQAVFSSGTAPFGLIGPAISFQPGTTNNETWHSVTVPTGMTGVIRVKVLAESKFAVLDVNVTITSTSAAPAGFLTGTLPSAFYYPVTATQPELSVQKAFTTVSNASPRVSIPTSGQLSLNMPGFATAATTCQVWGTKIYALD